jgi:hypothetical protein
MGIRPTLPPEVEVYTEVRRMTGNFVPTLTLGTGIGKPNLAASGQSCNRDQEFQLDINTHEIAPASGEETS